jgi:uncharacterized membrane protein
MVHKPAWSTVVLFTLVCLYALLFGVLAARAYSAHETGAFDLGVYDQPLWNAAQGRGLSLTLVPHLGPTRFAIHVEPILFLIVPIYRFVTDDPRLLLWLQTVVIALGGLPLYGLARRRLADDWAALSIVTVYLLLPALESVNLFDFHAVGLAPTLLLAALYFLDRALITTDDPRGLWTGATRIQTSNSDLRIPNPKGYRFGRLDVRAQTLFAGLSGLFFLLALGTKEDISLHVFMIGLYLLALCRRWRSGLALALAGLTWFMIAFYVIIPASRPTGAGSAYVGFFDTLGHTPLEIALSPIRTPERVLGLLVRPENIRALAMLTVPLALAPLVGLPVFIVAAPTLAITLLSSNPLMHQLETYHYAAPAIPFVILAAVDGIARLSDIRLTKRPVKHSLPPTTLLLSLVVLVVSLVYHYHRGFSPLARPFHWPMVTAHEQIGDSLAASIPPSAPLVAQAELVTLASHREWIQIWLGPLDEQADYFLWDMSHPAFVNRDGAQEKLLSDIARDPTVGPTATQDGYMMLQRDAARRPTTPEFLTFAYAEPRTGATPVNATFGNSLELVAFETHRNYADREAEPLITLYWRVLSPLDEDYFIAIFLMDDAGKPVGVTRYQQPLTVWWPTSRWEPGRTVRLLANTFPWWTGDRRRFSYGVAVVRGDEPWDVDDRLRVVRDDGGPAPLDDDTLLPLVGFDRVVGIPYEIKAEVEAAGEDKR